MKNANLLKNLIKEYVLFEKSVLDDFEKQKNIILQKLQSAEEELVRWEENEKKRSAFYEKSRELGYDPEKDSSRQSAKKRLKDDPTYMYDANLSRKGRKESILASIAKLKQEYSKYDPSVLDYDYEKNIVQKSTQQDKKESYREPIIKIEDLEYMKWIPWPENIQEKSGKSYGNVSSRKGDETIGVGPGEEWLSYLLGAKIQGVATSYDLVTSDGRTWEVKSVKSKNDTIRTGVEGKAAYSKAATKIRKVMKQIKLFIDSLEGKETLIKDDYRKKFNYVKKFYEYEHENIVEKEEISQNRIMSLKTALDILKSFKDAIREYENEKIKINIKDKSYKIALSTFVKLSNAVDPTLLDDIDPFIVASSYLEDSAFDDSKLFIDAWFDAINVENIFSQVSGGVFIVSPSAFLIIPKEQIKNVFTFSSITMGKPALRLMNI